MRDNVCSKLFQTSSFKPIFKHHLQVCQRFCSSWVWILKANTIPYYYPRLVWWGVDMKGLRCQPWQWSGTLTSILFGVQTTHHEERRKLAKIPISTNIFYNKAFFRRSFAGVSLRMGFGRNHHNIHWIRRTGGIQTLFIFWNASLFPIVSLFRLCSFYIIKW